MATLGSEPIQASSCHPEQAESFTREADQPLLPNWAWCRRWCRVRFALTVVFVALVGSPALAEVAPAPGRHLAGEYVSLSQHPRVFTTQAELGELAARIGSAGSYSAQRFGQLTSQIMRDLAARNDWGATYSGCNIKTYLYAFSYEPQDGGYLRTLQSDLQLAPSVTPPAGAAVVASRLALYAALVKAGAPVTMNAPDVGKVVALAKRILVAWGTRGFRDGHEGILSSSAQFCLDNGKIDEFSRTQVGLQISRGIIYSVQAEDLLIYLEALDRTETQRLDEFHRAMYRLVRNALNYNFAEHGGWACDCYSNHAASELTALLAVARLVDDISSFNAALYGGEGADAVTLPWTGYFERVIYGKAAVPNECYVNTGGDGLSSRPFFQTATVVAGEIDDRYRNGNPLQGIGYPMASLERLFDTAELLRIAGYDPYGYRGAHGQSIEEATEFYACYANRAGFGKVITAENAGDCRNPAQYVGKIVSGVDRLVMIGAFRFPTNAAILQAEQSAKRAGSTGPFALDAILFGRWRD